MYAAWHTAKTKAKAAARAATKAVARAATKAVARAAAKATKTAGMAGTAAGMVVAPWVDMSAYPHPDLAAYVCLTGHGTYTLAGISSWCGVPAWAGVVPLDAMDSHIRALQRLGGAVVVVFGGPNGIDLAAEVADADALACHYATVIERYEPIAVAFDTFLDDDPAMCRTRAAALARVQARCRTWKAMVCVEATPCGVADMAAVRVFRDCGADVDVVCLKTMNFGDAAAPNPCGKTMAWYVCQAALHAQCQLLDDGMTEATIGLCFMAGVNDVESEVVTLDDARAIAEFAALAPWVTYLGYWSVNRDRDDGQRCATPVSSGIAQRPFAFLKKSVARV